MALKKDDDFKFPNTPSFIVGFSAAAAVDYYIADKEFWWVFVLINLGVCLYATVKSAMRERK